MMNMEKTTQKVKEALQQAQVKALRYGHQEVDAEHVLFALLEQEGGLVSRLIEGVGASVPVVLAQVEYLFCFGPQNLDPVGLDGFDVVDLGIHHKEPVGIIDGETVFRIPLEETILFGEPLGSPGQKGNDPICNPVGPWLALFHFSVTIIAALGPQGLVCGFDPMGVREEMGCHEDHRIGIFLPFCLEDLDQALLHSQDVLWPPDIREHISGVIVDHILSFSGDGFEHYLAHQRIMTIARIVGTYSL